MNLEEYLAVPYILSLESFEGADGDWLRRASCPELPGCVVEGFSVVEIIARLDEIRMKCIIELLARGEPVPLPRKPINSTIPQLSRPQLEFARWLVENGHVSDDPDDSP